MFTNIHLVHSEHLDQNKDLFGFQMNTFLLSILSTPHLIFLLCLIYLLSTYLILHISICLPFAHLAD